MKINGQHYRTIWTEKDREEEICILDQRLLPHRIVIEKLRHPDDAIRAIKEMYVRGAGLIGATAGYAMHLACLAAPETSDSDFTAYLHNYAKNLDASRPTARNLKWAIDRVLSSIQHISGIKEKRAAALATAQLIADEDADFCRRIGQHGLKLLKEISMQKNGETVNILTHCNAGWLAFVDHGSATAPIYAARDAGIDVHVWVDETRPWNQGTRLTAWELQQEGVPNSLVCDNTGGHLMQHGMVDIVLVGSDRTTHTGDVANKIGTYLKALAAKDNNIPFYAALPSSTLDWEIDNGWDIPIEERSPEEITTITGLGENNKITTLQLAAPETRAVNHSFDVTPARLVSGIITERGIAKPQKEAIHALFQK